MEIVPGANKGDAISILKNHELFDITPSHDKFINTHETCFYAIDIENDIIELQYGGTDAVQISINLINEGVTTQLLFGPNAKSTWIAIDGNGFRCNLAEDMELESAGVVHVGEVSQFIRIQNGKIIQSACTGKLMNHGCMKLKQSNLILDVFGSVQSNIHTTSSKKFVLGENFITFPEKMPYVNQLVNDNFANIKFGAKVLRENKVFDINDRVDCQGSKFLWTEWRSDDETDGNDYELLLSHQIRHR